jgi:hypothetical protein
MAVLAAGVHDVPAELAIGVEEVEADIERRLLVARRSEDEA